MNRDYSDIIDVSYPPTEGPLCNRPRMSRADRAKIFAPFAALKGHGDAIDDAKDTHIERENTRVEHSVVWD